MPTILSPFRPPQNGFPTAGQLPEHFIYGKGNTLEVGQKVMNDSLIFCNSNSPRLFLWHKNTSFPWDTTLALWLWWQNVLHYLEQNLLQHKHSNIFWKNNKPWHVTFNLSPRVASYQNLPLCTIMYKHFFLTETNKLNLTNKFTFPKFLSDMLFCKEGPLRIFSVLGTSHVSMKRNALC